MVPSAAASPRCRRCRGGPGPCAPPPRGESAERDPRSGGPASPARAGAWLEGRGDTSCAIRWADQIAQRDGRIRRLFEQELGFAVLLVPFVLEVRSKGEPPRATVRGRLEIEVESADADPGQVELELAV